MSKECYDSLVAELEDLIKVQLPKAKAELVEAREKGDLSENFEYHAAKRAHGKLLGRIRFKQRVLEHSRVFDTSKLDSGIVGLLRKVTFTNLDRDMTITYTIVNPHEANPKEGKISIKSPVAEALMGRKVGDVVNVSVPAGKLRLRIDDISCI